MKTAGPRKGLRLNENVNVAKPAMNHDRRSDLFQYIHAYVVIKWILTAN